MQGVSSLYCPHLRTDKDRSNTGQSERFTNNEIYNVHSLIKQLKAKWAFWTSQMAVPEKDGIRNCTVSFQKTYSVVDVSNKIHNSWLCDLWQQHDLVVDHTPESSEVLSISPGADARLLLPSAGRPVDLLSTVVLDWAPSVMLSPFTLACAGLPERLWPWPWLPLRCLRCLPLCGLGLRDLVFMRTTVLSSSELRSELSEELVSRPEVGSWIWA